MYALLPLSLLKSFKDRLIFFSAHIIPHCRSGLTILSQHTFVS